MDQESVSPDRTGHTVELHYAFVNPSCGNLWAWILVGSLGPAKTNPFAHLRTITGSPRNQAPRAGRDPPFDTGQSSIAMSRGYQSEAPLRNARETRESLLSLWSQRNTDFLRSGGFSSPDFPVSDGTVLRGGSQTLCAKVSFGSEAGAYLL